jgi:phosphoglycerate dehydrogenase-like enzyme
MSKVVITPAVFFRVPGPYVKLLQESGFEVGYPPHPDLKTAAETVSELKGAAAVIAGGEYFTEEVLSQLPDLRVIARAGVGYDRVDVAAATRHNVAVTITPTANHECVAEHTLALLLALTRNVVGHHHDVHVGNWKRRVMLPLRGKTLGLIGLGRIGRSVAIRAAAFRLKILAYEKFPDYDFVRAHGIELVDIPPLLAQSDYVSLHVPLNDETHGLINQASLAKMKPGSFLVNTARGGLVVEKDLHAALKSGHLAGAALDVFEEEPTPVGNPLLQLDNVVATPHLAGGDTQSNEDMATESAQNIIALAQGGWPAASIVNPAIKPTFRW